MRRENFDYHNACTLHTEHIKASTSCETLTVHNACVCTKDPAKLFVIKNLARYMYHNKIKFLKIDLIYLLK